MASKKAPKTTRLSSDVDKPQATDPGDAPADTYDPLERAVSVQADKETAAANGHQTVNTVIPGDPIVPPPPPEATGQTDTVVVYDNDGLPWNVTYDSGSGSTGSPVAGVMGIKITGNDTVAHDGNTTLTATATFSDGNTNATGSNFTWASSDEGVATVTAAGKVEGVSGGEVTITATRETVTASFTMTVTGE